MPKRKVAKINKSKAGKGKKDGKLDTKVDKESEIEKAKANAALCELRLQVSDESLAQYREACSTLARANEELTTQLYHQERESLDITDYLKRQNDAKEEKLSLLQKRLESQQAAAQREQNKLVEDYTLRMDEMQELFRKREADFNTVQDGMRKIEEFQRTKAQMEQELEDVKVRMHVAQKEYRQSLNTMEQKFFKEKARLEREAEEKIALVLEKAHNEAIVQLDGTRRSVFKENVRLSEALKYHIKEAQQLQKLTTSLEKEKTSLALDKNTLESTLKENASLMEAQKQLVSKLRAKVASLDEALQLKGKEVEQAQERGVETTPSVPADQVELENLQKALAARDRELGHIKRLARAVVEQRTELEQFFCEALDQVKQEIRENRLRCKKEELQAYRWRLREAAAGRMKFPPIRTFHENSHSPNPVQSETEVAARWTHQPGSRVQMSDLTWEEKEQVLRLLFAKMNGQRQRKPSGHLALSASSEKRSVVDSGGAEVKRKFSGEAVGSTRAPQTIQPPENPNSLRDARSAQPLGGL